MVDQYVQCSLESGDSRMVVLLPLMLKSGTLLL
jgi:hypothetical protein